MTVMRREIDVPVAELFDSLEHGDFVVPATPVPGWRYQPITADGMIRNADPDTLEAPLALCGGWELERSQLSMWNRPRTPKQLVAIHHDPACVCGYRICNTLGTLRDYMRQESEMWNLDDPIAYGKDGFAAIALVSVEGHGIAAARSTIEAEHPGTIRITNYRLTGTVYIPRTWSHVEIPDSVADAVAARYPALTVERIPTLYEPPGVTARPAPTPSVDAYHPETERWGREGAASALIRNDGKFLIVRSLSMPRWEAPGGARGRHETYQDAALREAGEEAGYRPVRFETLADVHFEDRGWNHHSFAIDARSGFNTKLQKLVRAMHAPRWADRQALKGLAMFGALTPDFKRDLPELLAAFDRHDKENN